MLQAENHLETLSARFELCCLRNCCVILYCDYRREMAFQNVVQLLPRVVDREDCDAPGEQRAAQRCAILLP